LLVESQREGKAKYYAVNHDLFRDTLQKTARFVAVEPP